MIVLENNKQKQGAKMHLQKLSIQQDYSLNLEAFTQAALILFLAVVVTTSNAVVIATLINFRGLYKLHLFFYCSFLFILLQQLQTLTNIPATIVASLKPLKRIAFIIVFIRG